MLHGFQEVVGGQNHIECHYDDVWRHHFCRQMGKMQPTTSMLMTAASSPLVDMHTIRQRPIHASDIFQPRFRNTIDAKLDFGKMSRITHLWPILEGCKNWGKIRLIPDLVENRNKICPRETLGQFRSDWGHCKATSERVTRRQRPADVLQMDWRIFYSKGVKQSYWRKDGKGSLCSSRT